MQFFPGFLWAVPHAFSEAVSVCQFIEGDILYDSKLAYNDWSIANTHIQYSLQVRYPTRAYVGSFGSEDVQGAFQRGWNSKVRIDLYKNQEKVNTEQIETTQGRLFTLLWRGDQNILNLETDDPHPPVMISAVTKHLNQMQLNVIRNIISRPVFIMARDMSNSTSMEKYLKVVTYLKKYLSGDIKILNPQEAGLNNWKMVSPTIDIVFYPVCDMSKDTLFELVKKAVYTPAKNAKKDMFRLSAHGVILD